MNKISFNKHKLFQWLERELCAVLAVLIVGAGMVWVRAGTDDILMTLSVLPAAGTIQVNTPNGGESWQVGTSHSIEWLVGAGITDVKIELQRTTGGSWETIAATVTASDGSYSWTVTGSATTTAIIKISDTTDPLITDIGGGTFTITEAVSPPVTPPSPGGGGVTVIAPVVIPPVLQEPTTEVVLESIELDCFNNSTEMILDVVGSNFKFDTVFKLGDVEVRMLWSGNKNKVRIKIPKGFRPGKYTLTAYNSDGTSATLDEKVEIKGMYYTAVVSGQSARRIKLVEGKTAEVWVDFVNTGTEPWLNYGPNVVRLGTARPQDRKSLFWQIGWVKNNRPAIVQKPGFTGKQAINPGETGRFTFKITASAKPGNYVEYFSPVAEQIQWMRESMSFDGDSHQASVAASFEVVVTADIAKSSAKDKSVAKKKSLGKIMASKESQAVFDDKTEKALKDFVNWVGHLLSFNGIKSLWG